MIFNIFPHPCEVVDVLAGEWVEQIISILVEMFDLNVWADVVIDTLSGVQVDATIEVVSDIGVEVLTDVNANGLVVAMTDLQFAMSAP